jgi:phytoene synthase
MSAQVNAGNLFVQTPTRCSVVEAFAYCERMARSHYENFPVGSLLVPRNRRKYVYSIYAFARAADDFADEGYDREIAESDRLSALDDWERKLEACYRGEAEHPVFIALAETVKELDMPIGLFRDLLSAFKQDVVKRRYADFDEVVDYCRRSANPVGRLILLLFGYRDENLHNLSDEICTGLQLANFWQDVAVDIEKDRVYLPLDEMERYGVCVDDLRERNFTDRYAGLLKFQVDRAKGFFERGRSLPALVKGRLAFELRLTRRGGKRILEKIEELGYDTLNARPKITTTDKLRLLFKAMSDE